MIRISVHYIAVVPPTEGKSTTNRDEGIQVLRRAVAALDEIAAEPGHPAPEVDLCERLGLAKSFDSTLAGRLVVGLVGVDSHGRFALGERLLGFGGCHQGPHLAAAFRPTVRQGLPARPTGETVDLSVLRGQRNGLSTRSGRLYRLRAVSAVRGSGAIADGTANGKRRWLLSTTPTPVRALPCRIPMVAEGLRRESSRSGAPVSPTAKHTQGSAAAIATPWATT